MNRRDVPGSRDGAARGSRVLVAGLPRSGTTWLARMLASCEDTALVVEPDNPFLHPYALRKRVLPGGYYTALAPGEPAPAYEQLWREALGEGRPGDTALDTVRRRLALRLLRRIREQEVRTAFGSRPEETALIRLAEAVAVPARPAPARNLVVKSVQLPRALAWVAALAPDVRVVVVRRDVRSVVSSWLQLGWMGTGSDNETETAGLSSLGPLVERWGIPGPPEDALGRTTWLLGVLERAMAEAAATHPDWRVVHYEDLVGDTVAGLRALAESVGLRWLPSTEESVRDSDRPGTGFETRRVAATAADAWRRRLTPEQRERVESVLRQVAG